MSRKNNARTHHLGDDDHTPTERPTRTLDVHKPYIKTLTELTRELEAVTRGFSAFTHELLVARQPLEKEQLRTVRDLFQRLKMIGVKGKEGFAK